jgi:hypothetical protein
MPDFSSTTVGILAQLVERRYTQSELDNLFLRFDLRDAPRLTGRQPTKLARATFALTDALQRDRQDALQRILDEVIEGQPTEVSDGVMRSFQAALRSDGWSLDVVQYEPPGKQAWDSRVYERFELNPVGGGAVPLVNDTSALERLLTAHGLATAAGHYQQSVEAHANRRWASANSQLRATLESVLVHVANEINPTAHAAQGGAALNAIDKAGAFEKGERNYIDGLWTLAHSNGSHPGLSGEEESTNRLSAVTAAIAYLVRRFI